MSAGAPAPTVVARRGGCCPVCESSARLMDGEIDAWLCGSCRHTFVATLPNEAQIEDLYATYGYDEVKIEDIPVFLDTIIGELIDSFAPFKKTGRVLDVGFGNGGLLRVATTRGWEAHGIELSGAAIELGHKLGLRNLHHGDFLTLPLELGSYDVVVMSELIEHLTDPMPFLRRSAEVLRPGGLLFMTTPHGRGVSGRTLGASWSVLHPPQHLQLFSTESMRRCLLAAGFSTPNVYTQGILPHEIVAKLRSRLAPARDASGTPAASMGPDERVRLTCGLNETLTQRRLGRAAKRLANVLLRATSLGDSLRVRAER